MKHPKNFLLVLIVAISLTSCQDQKKNVMSHKYTNELIHETSPYLLQHAHNPVDWKPWSQAALDQAKTENKLVVVSIGYSSCHWCHVMEEESFEDSTVASVMNNNFISIKVDREERPDVDQVYMNAVQLMTGSGGWPLNVVLLPDGRPVWGGTYFPKNNWIDALNQLSTIQKDKPQELENYATRLAGGLKSLDIINLKNGTPKFEKATIANSVSKWSARFDSIKNSAPKFMMPSNYKFLLRYAVQENDEKLINYVHSTLQEIAHGGVYDQIGGGFSRYSVDAKWHVPHFEKMLYDNGQLLSLYSDAYLVQKNQLYKETVYQTVEFLKREMLDEDGGFYSALDADSKNASGELEEGAYYIWTIAELESILKEDFPLFSAYYNVNSYGHWEIGNYVLIRNTSDADFIKQNNIDLSTLTEKKQSWQQELLKIRVQRPAPRLDDKILTGWNALTISGLLDAYNTFGENEFLELALKNAQFIAKKQMRKDGGLNRNYKDGKSTINAYLEDYAPVIASFTQLFETTGDAKWLNLAEELTTYTLDHFYNPENGMFYFTSDEDHALITRNTEYMDNVIPASNSIMAQNLFRLGHLTFNASYLEKSGVMLHNIADDVASYPANYSNWMDLMLNYTHPFYEIVIIGENAEKLYEELNQHYIPNAVKAVAPNDNSTLDIFENRWSDNNTRIFICVNNACKLPVESVAEALKLIQK